MDHRVSKDMISSGMTPSGEKTQADLGKTQYGSAPSPNRLMDAYHSMYQNQKEKTLDEAKKPVVKVKLNPDKKIGVKVTDIGTGGKEYVRKNTMDEAMGMKTIGDTVKKVKDVGKKVVKDVKFQASNMTSEAGKNQRRAIARKALEDANTKNLNASVDLLSAYQSIYADTFEEGKIPAGLQAYLDKKKGKKKDDDDNGDEKKGKKGKKSKGGKPDFLDLDKDGDKKEPMKKASKEMKEGYGTATKVALNAMKPVTKKVGKFVKNNAGNIANAVLTGATVASFLPRPQPKDTKEEKEQVNEFLGTAVGGTVGTALGGPVGGLIGGATGAVAGEIAKKTTGMITNKMKKPIVSKNIGQNKKLSSISAGVDLFDVVKGRLLDEGLSEEEIKEIMLSLTPEEIIAEINKNENV